MINEIIVADTIFLAPFFCLMINGIIVPGTIFEQIRALPVAEQRAISRVLDSVLAAHQ